MHNTTEKIKKFAQLEKFQNDPTYDLKSLRKAPAMASIVWEAKQALKYGVDPIPLTGGTSTAFLLHDRKGVPLCVFKPRYHSKDDSYKRECAAYVLDHGNFAKTPPIVIATFSHELFGEGRCGSLQLYISNTKTPKEPFHFSEKTVHRVAQLDIRLLNGDRHSANLLLEEGELVPIDHQLALPDRFNMVHIEWMKWPQAQKPFGEEEKKYINAIDAAADRLTLMREWGFGKITSDLYYIATILLQVAVNKGLNAYQIGSFLTCHHRQDKNSQNLAFALMLQDIWKASTQDWEGFSKKVKVEVERIVKASA